MSPFMRIAEQRFRSFAHIDWFLLVAALSISILGLVTMRSFADENAFFERHLVWIGIAVCVFFIASLPSYHFLRRTPVIVALYGAVVGALALLFVLGVVVKGARERFDLGLFFLQPADPAKIAIIALLAKYFSRRHIAIAHFRRIFVSGAYAFVIFVLVFFQPDLGSALIIAFIWLGMVLVAGISWKHLAGLMIGAVIVSGAAWNWGLEDYQQTRILSFLHPLTDIQGAGYNAYQSTVAVGSGEFIGKGIGYGTQSKLRFLPEYQTDFIFASFAEEWGFVGVLLLFVLYGVLFWRIIVSAMRGASNFETLFALGVLCYFGAHFLLHTGINLGFLPVTGTTIPFMSYGGSHLLAEFLALGMLSGQAAYALAGRRGDGGEWSGGYESAV